MFYLVIKMWKNLYKKPYQTWKTVVTTFKKHQNVPMRTQKKRKIFFHRFLSEYTFLPTLLLFLKREWKLGKMGKLVRRKDPFFKK